MPRAGNPRDRRRRSRLLPAPSSDRHDAKRQAVAPAPRVVRPALMQELMRNRVDGAQCYLVVRHITSRFRLLPCAAQPAGRILQPPPGIVTSSLLLFKCRTPLDLRSFHMPTPDAATASLPDDPALLRIEGPTATITQNR